MVICESSVAEKCLSFQLCKAPVYFGYENGISGIYLRQVHFPNPI
jgi:hypothetical protein